MKKITTILVILVIIALFNTITNVAQLIRKPIVPDFGGVTNFDSLTLSEDLIVTDDATITDDLTVTDDATVTGRLIVDGGLTDGGILDLGETASVALTAAQILDNLIIQADADGSGDDIGASISFPDDETLITAGLSSGRHHHFVIDPTSSTSTTYLDLTLTGMIYTYVSTQESNWAGDKMILVDVWNTGTSLSWTFDSIDASVSYQLKD